MNIESESENEKYIYFYGINDPFYEFSNFFPCEFTDNKFTYNCSEQFFMKKKQETFDPTNIILGNKIISSSNPNVIKSLGRSVKNFNDEIWNLHKQSIMEEALYLKFSQNEELKNILINTSNFILVEASPYDKIWGIGISVEDANNNKKWNGQNLLGICLMNLRKLKT